LPSKPKSIIISRIPRAYRFTKEFGLLERPRPAGLLM
jgi:hypothetical protein